MRFYICRSSDSLCVKGWIRYQREKQEAVEARYRAMGAQPWSRGGSAWDIGHLLATPIGNIMMRIWILIKKSRIQVSGWHLSKSVTPGSGLDHHQSAADPQHFSSSSWPINQWKDKMKRIFVAYQFKNCRDPGSNRGPLDLQSNALPTELSRPIENCGFLDTKGSF
jgi:hypothetical protein